jgi:dextranase
VRLIDAIIFASGGYHIELGEPGMMLADPYFPDYGRMSDGLRDIVRRTYDFAVRYENVLSVGTRDATTAYAGRVTVEGVDVTADGSGDGVWPIVRESDHATVVSLINLVGIQSLEWDRALPADPPVQKDLLVQLHTDRPVRRVWWATPDGGRPTARPLAFAAGRDEAGPYVSFQVPALKVWDLIVLT